MIYKRSGLFFLVAFVSLSLQAQKYKNTTEINITKEWNGTEFTSTKSFAENIASSDSFVYVKEILEDEALVKIINDEEMVTIFAPLDEGFKAMTEKSRDSLLNDPQKLTSLLKFHIIPGRLDNHSIKKGIEQNNGPLYLNTLNNTKLGVREQNGQLILFDAENNTAVITATDFYHKNGFFHIIDSWVMPKEKAKL